MAKSKKIISLLLSVIMIMSVFTVVPFSISAEDINVSETGYSTISSYRKLDDGTYEILYYKIEGDHQDVIDGVINIPSEYDGMAVTSIGTAAFQNLTEIKRVIIPNSITNIGSSAFSGCTGLTSITISDSVTSIGSWAFNGCTGLTRIDIPDSVTSIGDSAFRDCTGLTSVTIGKSVNEFSFSENSSGDAPFYGCTNLANITVDKDNAVFDSRDNCNAIIDTKTNGLVIGCKNTIIPDSVTSIGYSAFEGCTGLTSLTIPDSVTNIGGSAFEGCTGLTSVTIPDSVTYIGGNAFTGTAWYDDQPDGLVYIGKIAYEIKVDCPAEVVIKDGTLSIANYAFKNSTGLMSVTIPDSVTSIGDGAFSGCTGLTNITIPNSVISIGNLAFYYCSGLTSVTIPDSVTSIGSASFCGCTSLVSASISNSVSSIGPGTFSGCQSLTSISFSDSITYIGKLSFSGCTSLKSIHVGKSVNSVHPQAFMNCPSLQEITVVSNNDVYDSRNNSNAIILSRTNELILGCMKTIIPDSVTSIGDGAFFGCTKLTSITIPDSVTDIGAQAFCDCKSLKNIDIPDSVTNIGNFAFSDTAWYENQPDGLVYVGKVAYKIKGEYPSEINIKDGTTSIAGYAFMDCEEITRVDIPDSVITIGSHAFDNCQRLKSVTIPDSISTIESYTFFCCMNLTKVYIGSSVSKIDRLAFYNCDSLTGVYIKDISKWLNIEFICEKDGSSNPLEYAHNLYLNDQLVTNLEIPTSVTTIKQAAMKGCDSLTSVNIPSTVTEIGYNAFASCTDLKNVTIAEGVTNFEGIAFYDCPNLKSISIPNSVTSIGNTALGYVKHDYNTEKMNDFKIYGYEGSEAERYANNNEFTFVPLKSKSDEATGITFDIPEDTELKVRDITGSEEADAIIVALPSGKAIATYDLSLTKDGEITQPDAPVTVKIPCDNPDAEVYRKEADGSLTDMNAVYKDGYYVFYTDHFSIYFVATAKGGGVTVSGSITSYVDDSDVTVKLTGVDINFTAEVTGKSDYSIEAVPAGEYTLTVSKANHVTREYTVTVVDKDMTQDVELFPLGDVTGDGKTNVQDCTAILRYVRKLDTLTEDQLKRADVTGDGKVNVQDVTRILRHVRKIETLY